MRVLLVDDEPALLDLWTVFLRGEGHDVRVASTRAGALDEVGQAWAEVVILDYDLPDGTIEPVVVAATACAPRPGIVLSSGLGAEVGEDLLVAVDVVLPKPTRLKQLRAALEAARQR